MASKIEVEAKKAANKFRQTHGLGTQPLGDLVALIEQTTGHDVAILEADSDEHGLIMRDPARDRVFIGVARTLHPMRQRSSLAHELGHVVFDDRVDEPARRSSAEPRADAFARHLLIPLEGLTGLLDNEADPNEALLSNVVQRFLVSPEIAAIALREAGHIYSGLATEWVNISTPPLAKKFGWNDHHAALQADFELDELPPGIVDFSGLEDPAVAP